jgi:hypothetical protein
MSTTAAQKQSILALAAGAAALASAAQALAATFSDETAPTAKPEPAKAAPKAKPAETPKTEPAKTPAAPAAEPAKPAAVAPAGNDIISQCRAAAKSYAEVYGREGLKEVLKKYTEGTLADVAPEKLPALLAELS